MRMGCHAPSHVFPYAAADSLVILHVCHPQEQDTEQPRVEGEMKVEDADS